MCNNFNLLAIIAIPLGWLMWLCYTVSPVYWLALLLFTILTRLLLFPLSLKQHKSTAKMAVLKPKVDEIQKKYATNKEKLQQETMKVYQEAGYSPLSGCLPTILQLVVLFGLINVIYNPLQHILQFNAETVAALQEKATVVAEAMDETYAAGYDMYIITYMDKAEQAVKTGKLEADPFTQYDELVTEDVMSKLNRFDMNLFGMFLGEVPKFPWVEVDTDQNQLDESGQPVLDENGNHVKVKETVGWTWMLLLPVLSGVTSFLTSFVSMKFGSGGEASMGGSMKTMMYIMPLFSVWIGFSVPAGVVLYWIYSNLVMMGQTLLLHKKFNVQRYIEEYEEKEAQKALEKKAAKKHRPLPEGPKTSDVELPPETKYVDERTPEEKAEALRLLNEARRRDAERYGEAFVEATEDDLN